MKPIRIQRKRTKGWRMPVNTIYVGRPTRWGNPFVVGEHGNAQECVDLFARIQENMRGSMIRRDLKGKNLACWCPLNQPCHADVLLKIANS